MLRHGFFFLNEVHKKVLYGRISIRWNRFYKKIKNLFLFGTLQKNHKRYTIQNVDEKHSLIQIDNEKKLY